MADSNQLIGQKLAVLLWARDEDGEDQVACFEGIVTMTGSGICIDRGAVSKPFPLSRSWIERVSSVPASLTHMFPGCSFMLSLTVGSLPESAEDFDLEETGLVWPPKD